MGDNLTTANALPIVGTNPDRTVGADKPDATVGFDYIFTASSVPEPGSVALLLGGFGLLAASRAGRRR
ncbi:MAG: PEP-CTERM sorting domain-containing protein [Dechloromonas sp.]|nr:PEP-CTERM sorting domain-containing protein [Dechloromonas sp.]